MKRSTKIVRKLLAALIGFPLLVFGIVLIPLPGPGVLVCIVALYILSREFDWALKHLEKAQKSLGKIISISKKRAEKLTED